MAVRCIWMRTAGADDTFRTTQKDTAAILDRGRVLEVFGVED